MSVFGNMHMHIVNDFDRSVFLYFKLFLIKNLTKCRINLASKLNQIFRLNLRSRRIRIPQTDSSLYSSESSSPRPGFSRPKENLNIETGEIPFIDDTPNNQKSYRLQHDDRIAIRLRHGKGMSKNLLMRLSKYILLLRSPKNKSNGA